MDKKNVIGVAEGEKWTNGKTTGQKAILVFVEQKEPISNLDPDDIIENEIDGVPTDVVGKSGKFVAEIARKLRPQMQVQSSKARKKAKARARAKARRKALAKARARARARAKARAKAAKKAAKRKAAKRKAAKRKEKIYKLNPKKRYRPIIGGLSVSHRKVTAGTIGAIFKDSKKRVVMLSNNHVLANTNNAKKGDVIYQPGTYDKSPKPQNVIGYLSDFVPLKNGTNQDSAIAIVKGPYQPTVNRIGRPTGTRVAKIGLKVVKSGRTTNLTKGRIIGINGKFKVNYGNKSYVIKNCIVTTDMSRGGDSGSLLLDTNKKAVGLLFAGSDTMTLHNPINPIIKRYKLKFL